MNRTRERAAPQVRLGPFLLLVVAPPLLISTFALGQTAVSPVDLFRDPLQVADMRVERLRQGQTGAEAYCCPYWLGAISNVGVLAWAATSGALLLAWAVRSLRAGPREARSFLLMACCLTALLAVDDALQLHEQRYFAAGIKGEVLMFPLFGVLALAYLRFWRVLRRPYSVVLWAALGCLSLSVAVDQLPALVGDLVLFEDITKLFGIFLWCGFHLMLSIEELAGMPLVVLRARAPARS